MGGKTEKRVFFLAVAAWIAGGLLVCVFPEAARAEDDRYVTVAPSIRSTAPRSSGGAWQPFLPVARTYAPTPGFLAPMLPDAGQSYGDGLPDGGAPIHASRMGSAGSASSGPAVMCVRTCDGFFFPVAGHDSSIRGTICQASCPDGDTVLFEGSRIEDARDAGGRRYGDLPTAFLYRTKRVDQCTCRRDPGDVSRRLPVTSDPTLRRGDIVTTEASAVVFAGGRGGLPHRKADFQPFETSALLGKGERSRLVTLLGQSRDQLLARAGRPLDAGGRGRAGAAGDDGLPSIIVTRPNVGKAQLATSRLPEPTGPRIVLPRPGAPDGDQPQL
jgi:hypothetical protein